MANPRITVEINGDSSKLHSELGKADKGVMGFAGSLKSLAGTLGAAFSVQQILSFAGGLMKTADAARDTADALGESLKNVVGLTRLGAQAGVEQEKVLNWLQRVKQAQEEVIATNGTGANSKLLAGLGVNLTDFANAGPAKGLEMIVKAAGDAGDGIRTLNTILGRLSAVDVKDALGKLATEGLDKIAESAGKAAEATQRLADQQARLDKGKAAFQEKAAGILAGFFERGALANKGLGLSEGNLIGLLAQSLPILGSPAMLAGKMKGGIGSVTESVPSGSTPVTITGADPKSKAILGQSWADQTRADMTREEERRANDREREDQRTQAAAAKDERDKDIRRRGSASEMEIRRNGMEAIAAIQVQLPRLSGIESLGAVLGGTGGAARTAVERQIKIMDAQTDMMKKLVENTQKTAEALIES